MDELPDLEEVTINCTAKDCANDKHLYRPPRGKWKKLEDQPSCQGCGDTSVDMSITRARNIDEPEAIFKELGREFIRDHYLKKPFDKKAKKLIRRYGVEGTRDHVASRLKSAIGRKPTDWDGRQTKYLGNVLFYAQHATATCCRKCTYYWYGIQREEVMSEKDMEFCVALVQSYIDRRQGEISAIAATPAESD